jgi:hypothetical protein
MTLPPNSALTTIYHTGGGTTKDAEALGTKIMFGATVAGRRMTSTSPAGANGNDRPITTTREIWIDLRNGVVVMSKDNSRAADSTMTMENYSDAEPAPALFQPPRDFTLVDETGPFTILLPRAN